MPVAADLPSRLACCAALLCSVTAALADDGRGLKRGGDSNQISISGLSSGAAMAVQYAVAHSASVRAVGAVAGPQWGCADGSVSRAINDCMCGRGTLTPTIDTAHQLAAKGAIDKLTAGKPQSLRRAWVFQSPADETVSPRSGKADATFLADFIGTAPEFDQGNAVDGSDRAGHGIIAPDGSDSCTFDSAETSYVRHCGAEDNAGKMFHTLFGAGTAYNPSDRAGDVPEAELWSFDQRPFIEQVKAEGVSIANDYYNPLWLWWPASSARRQNFDMADKGYIYVPPSCRSVASACRVHVALHGCKQDARVFASTAGYNNWAEHYKVIVVYPAIARGEPIPGAVCRSPALDQSLDLAWVEPNLNGCWDWWGYLDTSTQQGRYLTKEGPQIRVIRAIITAATTPQAN